MNQTLVIMVKEPRAGRVKTRLGRDIGMTAAAWWFRHQVAVLIRQLYDPRWEIVLAVSPDHAGLTSRMWPLQIRRIRQGQGDLGDRMARVLQGHRPGPVCVIGADIPGINRADIAQAFKVLGPCEAVFGPAADGGYWLVGLKNARPAPVTMFEQVRWSTQYALADSVASVRGLRIAYLSEKHDVDTLHDLRMTTDSTRAT